MTAIDMLRERGAQIVRQAEAALELQPAGEGSSTCLELDMLLAEQEFLVALGRELAGHKSRL